MCSKKIILYLITQSESGGAQQYIFDLATNLKNEFNIFVAFGEQGEQGELAARLQVEEIKFYAIKHLKRNISPINDFLALIEIIKLIKKLKPDIVHLNSSKISILGSVAAKICFMFHVSCYVIYTVHGWVFNEPLPFWKKKFYYFAEKFTAKFKDKLICVSEYDRQIALKEKIATENKIITIHNGKKPINFLPRQTARVRLSGQIFNLPRDYAAVPCGKTATEQTLSASAANGAANNILIGSIGNLYKTKGFEYFIQAIYALNANYKLPLTAVIIGEGEERKYLEDLIAQLNLKNNFILAGRIDNAAELLPAFDIFVLPSVKEGLPYTILEAMQAGLPIVSTNVGGIPEMIEDGKTGLLIEPNNPQILAEKIYQLLNNPDLCRKLGEQAKQKVINEFSLESMIKKTKEIYLVL